MKILSIETSCDDTGVALLDICGGKIKIVADFVSSQNAIHDPFGGVVPNLAVRAHYKNLPILLERVLAKIDPRKIDLIVVTIGPGLEPCLWAGVNTAKMLAVAMKKPIVGVNHLEGHIAANWLQPICGSTKSQALNPKQIQNSHPTGGHPKGEKLKTQNSKLLFPAICLIVSGGHTQLVLIKDIGKYKIIGQTRDDAAGEAFDKVAKMLGLGYPGGPQIALWAKNGRFDVFKLPRPMLDSPDYDFSFSGLKTAVRYLLQEKASVSQSSALGFPKAELWEKHDLCASFQQAVVDVLISKTIKAAIEYRAKTIMLSGGVAANSELRQQMSNAIKNRLPTTDYRLPPLEYCTDNAVMIGLAGYWKYQRSGEDDIEKVVAEANLNL